MPTGINATIVSITDGTTAHASDVLSSLQSLNTNGVSNDGGNITTDGSGNMTLPSVKVTTNLKLVSGTLSRISLFSGTSGGVFNHGLGVTPDIILLQYAGSFGSPPGQPIYYFGVTSTQVTVSASSSYSWVGVAIKL